MQVGVELVDGEAPCRSLQERPRQGARRQGVLDSMAFDHVAQEDQFDVVLERLHPLHQRHHLNLREPADVQVREQATFDL